MLAVVLAAASKMVLNVPNGFVGTIGIIVDPPSVSLLFFVVPLSHPHVLVLLLYEAILRLKAPEKIAWAIKIIGNTVMARSDVPATVEINNLNPMLFHPKGEFQDRQSVRQPMLHVYAARRITSSFRNDSLG